MRFSSVLVIVALAITPAFAQQPASPTEQALSGKLQDEINQDMQVRNVLAQANAHITELQKQVDDLKAKYESKSGDKK